MRKVTALVILDGWGINPESEGNAIMAANTPNFDRIKKENPYMEINSSGEYVGLPHGQMGNSEVGHLNIGAGRIVYQELTRITKAIKEGDFFTNPELLLAVENAKNNDSALHLLGLLSDGGVHSHINHIKGLLDFAKLNGLTKVYLHAFMDGRDTSPTSGISFVNEIESYMKEKKVGKIATISGRYYAMDRDNRWERIEKAYQALVFGKGEMYPDAVSIMEATYRGQVTDEFVLPSVILENDKPTAMIQENDSVVFFNFRPDRARQMTNVLTQKDFDHFERKWFELCYVTMTQYDIRFKDLHIAFKPQELTNTLGEYISELGLKQLRIAETEKYAHVTFFFNGGVEKENQGEDRVLIPSPKVATYDLKPEMSAYEVADRLLEELVKKKYDLIVVNFANADMVGHSGSIEAAIKAVEAVDENLGRVIDKIIELNGKAIITADHGNAEKMIDDKTHEIFTAHSTNPVPLIIVGESKIKMKETGKLSDIAPTLLKMMDIEQPKEFSGQTLFEREE